MPYCTQCGTQVSASDSFCSKCGGMQPGAPPNRDSSSTSASSKKDFTDSIDDRTWTTLCYLPGLGWLASVFVLAAARFQHDRNSRFHAFQGLYLFVAWLILDWGVGPFIWRGEGLRISLQGLFHLALIGVGIFMMVKTYNREHFRLPVFGELADRSLADHP